jgi:hypothetical protein
MKSSIVKYLFIIVIISFTISAFAKNSEVASNESFNLVHWNVLKNMYQINGFFSKNPMSVQELKTNKQFNTILQKTFTPDSYVVLLDQNTRYIVFPDPHMIGKTLISLKNPSTLAIVKKSIDTDSCTRGFYTWIDNKEKYMVVCPLIGKTTDGFKLFYVYAMYTRSMPDYYLKTLKSSKLD